MLGKVSGVDVARREVIAEGRRIPFDYLILATGARARLFRPRRLGRLRARPEDHRRRDLYPPPHPARLREGRDRARSRRARAAAELRRRRRRPDRRRDGRRHRRTGEPRAADGLPLDRSALRAHHPGRGGAAPADAVRSVAVGGRAALARTARRRGAARRARVTALDADGVSIGAERIEARTIIWAAGVMASPAGQWLGAETDRAGRVKVDAGSVGARPSGHLRDRRHRARSTTRTASRCPASRRSPSSRASTSPSCCWRAQQGKTLAAVPLSRLRLARHHRAQARRRPDGPLKLKGFIAWLLWSVAHIYFLIGFRNRLVVAMNWLWNYLTFQRGTRLITGMSGARMEDMPLPRGRKKGPARRVLTRGSRAATAARASAAR